MGLRGGKVRQVPDVHGARVGVGKKVAPQKIRMPEVKVVALSTLKAASYNPRSISPEALAGLRKSMELYGYADPIIVNRRNQTVIGGHQRLKVLRDARIESAPVSLVDLDPKAERQLNVALNSPAIAGDFTADLEGMIEEFRLDLPEMDFKALKFDELFKEIPPDEAKDIEEDDAPEPPVKAISKTGDLWEVGPHRIVFGDSTDGGFVSLASGDSVPDIMVTDPPYGVEYEPEWRAKAGINKNRRKMGKVSNDDRADWYEAWALFKGDVAYVYHAGIRSSEVFHSLTKAGFVVRSQIVWAKDRMALSRGDYHWQHEPAWYAVRKGKPSRRNSDRTQTTLWSIPSREDAGLGHGTQKPIECMGRPIRNHGMVGDRIYDPFLGSGTTAVASHKLDRVFCGIELNPIYVDVSVLRLMRCAPDLPVKCSRPEAAKEMRARFDEA